MNKGIALGLSVLALVSLALAQSTMAKPVQIGTCKISGKLGSYKMTPAIKGQLTIQTNLPGPGFFNGNNPKSIKDGFEYCLAANIANRLGIPKVVVQNVGWDAMVAGQTKKFDFALSQISITPERKKVVDFSTPYYSSGIGILVRTGQEFQAADIASKRIGIQQGTTAEALVNGKIKPTQKIRVYPDVAGGFTALVAGQIDAFIVDTSIVLSKATESKGALAVIGQYETDDMYGALFLKGSKNRAVINKILAEMIKDGTVKKLAAQYVDAAKVPFWK